MTACLRPCSDMTNTDEALHCVALRAGLCQIQTGPTCMQLADRTCPQHHWSVGMLVEQEVGLRVCRNNLHISELEYFISESIFCILRMKLHISC
jgi:hypothetical protein